MENNSGVYAISFYSGESSHVYIGSSVNLYNRKIAHGWAMKNQTHHNPIIQRCWNKYGKFEWEILETCPKDLVREREQFWLDLFCGSSTLINLATIARGGSVIGVKRNPVSAEGRRNMSIAFTGRKLSEEHKKKISIASSKFRATPELKEKLSKAQSNRSQETKDKLSASKMGHPVSEETKAKISKANTGKKRTVEQKQNRHEAMITRRNIKGVIMNRKGFLKVLGAAIAAPFLLKAKPASDPYKGDDRARAWNEQAAGLSVENLNHARDVLSSRIGPDGEKLSIGQEYHVYPPEIYVLDCFFDARLGPATGKAIIGCVGKVFDFGNRVIISGWGFLKCPDDFNRLENQGILAGYTIDELKQITKPDSLIALFDELGDPGNDNI